jgi:HD superfamily phosphohydrolase
LESRPYNKRKIINDPVYGFINIPTDLIFDLIAHPWFQRLRRIKQLGLTHLVYPGALHTRFNHSLGAMHLMQEAIQTLRRKGIKIKKEEREAVTVAILLHDIGHGPFSHALEHSIVHGIDHEVLSEQLMNRLNEQFSGRLDEGLAIFNHQHPKSFLSQLVSSQLDMDRIDYLTRDSFFTGVSEGVIGTQRLIKMLHVANDELVIEEKGIYSIEKFIVARRIMYWQVYLHKTVLAAETMLIKILERAKYLSHSGEELFATPALSFFLKNDITRERLKADPDILSTFALLDDTDIFTAIKAWSTHPDSILQSLCKKLVNRQLFRCEIQRQPFEYFYLEELQQRLQDTYQLTDSELPYFFITDTTSNYAYKYDTERIQIRTREGRIIDLDEASDQFANLTSNPVVTKHVLCYPKDVDN